MNHCDARNARVRTDKSPHAARRARARTHAFVALLTAVATLAAMPARALVSCSTAASGVSFGVYNPLGASANAANGTVTVTCNLLGGGATTVGVSVSLSTGLGGSYVGRSMPAGSYALGYNLYWSTAYAQIWGDGTGGSYYGVGTLYLAPSSPTQSVSGAVYGRIPAGQDVGAGSYLDTIVITVSY